MWKGSYKEIKAWIKKTIAATEPTHLQSRRTALYYNYFLGFYTLQSLFVFHELWLLYLHIFTFADRKYQWRSNYPWLTMQTWRASHLQQPLPSICCIRNVFFLLHATASRDSRGPYRGVPTISVTMIIVLVILLFIFYASPFFYHCALYRLCGAGLGDFGPQLYLNDNQNKALWVIP